MSKCRRKIRSFPDRGHWCLRGAPANKAEVYLYTYGPIHWFAPHPLFHPFFFPQPRRDLVATKWSTQDLVLPMRRRSLLTSRNTKVSFLAEHPPDSPTRTMRKFMTRKVTHSTATLPQRKSLPNQNYPPSLSRKCFGTLLSFNKRFISDSTLLAVTPQNLSSSLISLAS